MYDLLLKGGNVVDPSTGLDGIQDVAVQGGAIARIAPSIASTEATRTIDVSGKIVAPGLIDVHVGVDVDEAGRDDLSRHVDRPRGFGARDARRDAGDRATLNGDVLDPVEPGGRVDDVSTFEQEIVHSCLPGDRAR